MNFFKLGTVFRMLNLLKHWLYLLHDGFAFSKFGSHALFRHVGRISLVGPESFELSSRRLKGGTLAS